jgi:hypothetical protein
MSVTTPSTGQKISDFSVGTVDANSFLIQARNGSTEKVSASQIGQFSNLNLLFSGAGGLDTTAKTIVGAINEGNGKEAEDIPYDNTSSGLSATDVQAAIDAINSTSAPLFYLGTYSYTAASVGAGENITISRTNFSISYPSGYVPIAIGKVGVSKAGYNITSFNVSGVSSVLSVRNGTSAAIANTTFSIDIIYVKSNFVQRIS